MKIAEYNFPDELLYDIGEPGHIWIRRTSPNSIQIGIDNYAASKTGDIEFVRTMPNEKNVKKGQVIGTYESGKWIGQIKSPITGKIIEKNVELKIEPALINMDPYGRGWILKIEGKEIEEELESNKKIVEVGENLEKHILWRISNEK